jgi:hypothetical protein
MPFLNKCACTAPRALLLEDCNCPPDDVPHLPSKYPKHYDPLYYLQYHSSVFETPKSVCEWLTDSVKEHQPSCHVCTHPTSVMQFQVEYAGGRFHLTLGTAIATLSVSEIECPSFSLCRVLCLFATVGEGSFHSTKTILLNILQNLHCLCALQPMKITQNGN